MPGSLLKSRRKVASLALQLKYAVLLTLVSSLLSLIMMFVLAWFVQRNYSLFLGDGMGIPPHIVDAVRREEHLLELSLFFLFMVTIAVTFGVALHVTRRLTGPVAAVTRALALYARGDFSREFKLRKNDEFKELEDLLNRIRDQALNRQRHELT